MKAPSLGRLSFRPRNLLIAFFFFSFVFTLAPYRSAAVVKSQQWQESHRGYSLEQIPGTGVNGIPIEYVAAGTMYTNGPGRRAGWHFMRIDEFGNVLATRIAYCNNTDNEFRVVDIAVESSDKFWITMSARHLVSASQYDYIYIAGVDQNGNDLPTNPAIALQLDATNEYYHDVYPTHSIYMGDALYICGYAAYNTAYPNMPSLIYSGKVGMFMKCDVNSTPVTTTSDFWDSANFHEGPGDYDMPLRISPSNSSTGFQPTFPLLVTGSVNIGDGNISGILAMKYGSNGNLITANGFLPVAYAMSYVPARVTGVYGVDMRGTIYPDDDEPEGGGYCILVNFFDELRPYDRTWGILRIKNNLSAYDPMNNYSFVYLNGAKSWGNQFTELFYADKSMYSAVTVLGQQNALYGGADGEPCDELTDPNRAPAHFYNYNPFVANIAVSGAGIWNSATGFGWTYPSTNFTPNVVHLSSMGTVSNDMNYLAGSLGAGALLEDITRLYTFGAGSHYYYGQGSSNFQYPAMVVPVGEYMSPPGNNPYLNTKFIQTDVWTESECNNYYRDCPTLSTSPTHSFAEFSSVPLQVNYLDAYTIFGLTDDYTPPIDVDCSTGYYKPTGIAAAQRTGDELNIYPNPASSEIFVQLPVSAKKGSRFTLTLVDMAGKEIFNFSGTSTASTIHIDLPQLASGIYLAQVTLDGERHQEKLTIQ